MVTILAALITLVLPVFGVGFVKAETDCSTIDDSNGRARCIQSHGAAAAAEAPEAQEQEREEEQASNLDCGNGGVKIGVAVKDGSNCIGEGDKNPIIEYLGAIIAFLSAGVGIVVTAVIVIAGIQYATAGANPQSVSAAKNRILNAIIALLMYIFMVGILNFLVPGGVF